MSLYDMEPLPQNRIRQVVRPHMQVPEKFNNGFLAVNNILMFEALQDIGVFKGRL